MPNSINLSLQERKKFQRIAILSTWFGCVTEQLLDSNSMIIIYLIALGGNESFSMFSTALSGICAIFMVIPSAGLAGRIGLRYSYRLSGYGSAAAFLLMAAAPSIMPAGYAKYLVIAGCFIFCLMRSPYSVAWFPMLDVILAPAERGSFFGKMRFSYFLLNAGLLYLIGKLLGSNPPLYLMQLTLAFAGIVSIGRMLCMDRMPENPDARTKKLDIRKSLNISIRNAPLVGFSFYSCFFNIATASALPLAVIYMKTRLNFSAETIMTATSLYMVGQVSGCASVGLLTRKLGTRWFQIITHTMFTTIIGVLAMLHPGTPYAAYILYALLLLLGIGASYFLCLNSIEMLASAKPGNKIMASAFCQTFTNLGTAIGRMGTTLILAAGVLAADWKFFGIDMSCYNFIFMFYFAMIVFFYLLLLLSPSIIPKHDNYYNP